jgi:hypothetical protein
MQPSQGMNRRHQVQDRRPGFNPPLAAGGGVPPLALKRAPRAATQRSAVPDALARHRAHARPRGRETSPPPPATPRLCLGAPHGDGGRRRSGDGEVGRRELGFLPPVEVLVTIDRGVWGQSGNTVLFIWSSHLMEIISDKENCAHVLRYSPQLHCDYGKI